ncbi:MAG: hypothetical protein ACJAVK_003357 [Akkermansiaceae bacterium]|jgi:hypothetical protein
MSSKNLRKSTDLERRRGRSNAMGGELDIIKQGDTFSVDSREL